MPESKVSTTGLQDKNQEYVRPKFHVSISVVFLWVRVTNSYQIYLCIWSMILFILLKNFSELFSTKNITLLSLVKNYVSWEQNLVPVITISGRIPVKNVHQMRYKPFLILKPHVPELASGYTHEESAVWAISQWVLCILNP